ncbi:hypothetical protein CYLTODRAFT_390269 [Cylindrobasidium torrendii FP15055 ss-10]|uniref:ER lumen protein retaining receptor n=1 Tax=Cylindrobasidium torrendii FP15055 ss-10 TaxID=1314674 RepID=A0A0D7BLW4_9AGAR|nr:hypothetical protein CYLTODRAFT_390269 [Cylindrobasidium torrendii FP15055 ss-10]
MASLNVFRIAGDFAHFSSKCILLWAIHRNKSAEGVSLLTQIMYAFVFVTRYLDLLYRFLSIYNTAMKVFYIASSLYIIFAMLKLFPYTRESHKAWGIGIISTVASAVLAIPIPFITYGGKSSFFFYLPEITWTFSIILESICIIPQLIILRQTEVPTVIDSFYLLALGSYRAFYILNWIYRWASEGWVDPVAFIFGVIQTALYVDFAWVYYSRQRIKLRGGALVDGQDFGRGWLVRWIVGKDSTELEQGDADGIFDADVEEGRRDGTIALPPDPSGARPS